jgi:hypothetical protein
MKKLIGWIFVGIMALLFISIPIVIMLKIWDIQIGVDHFKVLFSLTACMMIWAIPFLFGIHLTGTDN